MNCFKVKCQFFIVIIHFLLPLLSCVDSFNENGLEAILDIFMDKLKVHERNIDMLIFFLLMISS